MTDRWAAARAMAKAQSVEQPPSLFDAHAEADTAIASVADTWRGDILERIEHAVNDLAERHAEFTADDVRDALDFAEHVDLRVVGAALRNAARKGVIVSDGFALSRYRHGAPQRLWRSLVVRHD